MLLTVDNERHGAHCQRKTLQWDELWGARLEWGACCKPPVPTGRYRYRYLYTWIFKLCRLGSYRQLHHRPVSVPSDQIFVSRHCSPIKETKAPFSRSVVSDSLRPDGLQYARLPCPSPTPGVYSNSCPLSRWCHPTISSSVVPFSSRLQSFPASECFLKSRFFTSGSQNIGVSASVSVVPMNIQDWFPLGLTGLISL